MPTDEHPAVRFRDGFGPAFLVTVDVEEDFDWTQPLARENTAVDSVVRLRKFQTFCEGAGVIPCYLVDYPVANSSIAQDILGGAFRRRKADVGLQLHPWVTPPHDEEVNCRNSFAGNLPPALERAKIATLAKTVRARFGVDAKIYRAGRYGIGPNTIALLGEEGIAIDSSVRAYHDYHAEDGPDFSTRDSSPAWVGRDVRILELPLTTVFTGLLRRHGPKLYRRSGRVAALRGAAARLGLLNRVPLTPEGVSIDEAKAAIDHALGDGLPILNFAFHSPSLVPGNTPYVRDNDDLDAFYDWWREILAHLDQRGVRATDIGDIMGAVELD
ncbi:polysaccharide deacetylase family protein [Blastomonas marina]|uniref:WalW protein n=1 Tax=Blastomonas marina TaxID=1867408 RepID=A0ABQ1FBQ5_9SPHN|nr:polysaccharide deacetylase family protein [Blastomonas marina]WPZ05131.1 polysaccharide deacetylase family protein [Blastomonas marina]GGA06154.1 hypothetical protein GCM10010923_14970 [Blastomonas marina]